MSSASPSVVHIFVRLLLSHRVTGCHGILLTFCSVREVVIGCEHASKRGPRLVHPAKAYGSNVWERADGGRKGGGGRSRLALVVQLRVGVRALFHLFVQLVFLWACHA